MKPAKTKTYFFTEDEAQVIRNALVENYHQTKHLRPKSPLFYRQQQVLKSIKEQFQDDCRNW